jgi:hypothetical protein
LVHSEVFKRLLGTEPSALLGDYGFVLEEEDKDKLVQRGKVICI